MEKNKIFLVIPTIRDLDFLEFWGIEFKKIYGVIVEDSPVKKIKTPVKYFKKVYHYAWEDIDNELKDNSWIIPRKNAGIRIYGFLKAYQMGADIIVTLDDDCYPIKNQNFLNQHIRNLNLKAPIDNWFSTYPHKRIHFTRGFPYKIRNKSEVVLSHGLWTNKLDLDAKTEIKIKNLNEPILSENYRQFIPKDFFFPLCSMNFAFKAEITPILFFPMMGYDKDGNKWSFDRYDDIWAGIFAKKVLDHLNLSVVNGIPFIDHRKASNVKLNLKKERLGMIINEYLYKEVLKVKLTKKDLKEAYLELFDKIDFSAKVFQPKDYFVKLKKAVRIWIDLFL